MAALIVMASSASCVRAVAGSAEYEHEIPAEEMSLVKIAELPELLPTPVEARSAVDSPGLLPLFTYRKPESLPSGALSEPGCTGAIIPNAASSYGGSGHVGIYGRLSDDLRTRRVSTGVAAFGSAEEARAFVENEVQRWTECSGRVLTITMNDRIQKWDVAQPARAYGVDVLMRREEGAPEYACARAVGSRSNIAADVLVCGREGDAVKGQAGKVVNLILDKVGK